MKKIPNFNMVVFTVVLISILSAGIAAQDGEGNKQSADVKKYEKDGIAFDYEDGWEVSDQVNTNQQQINLANKETDSQILLIILSQKMNAKDPMPDLKKQVIDPWVTQLVDGYIRNKIPVERTTATTEVANEPAEGVRIKFVLDDQLGGAEAYWVLLDKRLVLLYFIRPDKTSEKAGRGWDVVRKSLHVETVAKK